jgi:integrase/recombinase XerC
MSNCKAVANPWRRARNTIIAYGGIGAMNTALALTRAWTPASRRDIIDAFMNGRKSTTLTAYRQDIADFASFLGMPECDAVETLLASGPGQANMMALNYRSFLLTKGLQPTTINRRLATLRSLTKFARMCGWINWKIEIASLKTEAYRDTTGPGTCAYRQMLAQIDTKATGKAIRDRAILRLLHDLGLRRGELVAMDMSDVAIDAGTISIMGKGRMQAERLSLPGPTRAALRAWLEIRGDAPGALFTNFDRAGQGSGRLTGTAVYKIVRGLGQSIGVATRPHGLRHLAVTEAVRAAQRAGMGIEDVLDFSRHADLKTLMIYVDRDRNNQGRIAEMIS